MDVSRVHAAVDTRSVSREQERTRRVGLIHQAENAGSVFHKVLDHIHVVEGDEKDVLRPGTEEHLGEHHQGQELLESSLDFTKNQITLAQLPVSRHRSGRPQRDTGSWERPGQRRDTGSWDRPGRTWGAGVAALAAPNSPCPVTTPAAPNSLGSRGGDGTHGVGGG
ncbi:hypothetical protein EYF80_000393 [Liparis tanakae]|uniref:Uncharacterized protein n=1 Tax=Liparis tanakae TaxID=230148 RepID=A0A4Z2JFT1_9TELE|nr:hypothetical protein EYF80_000393 [Liparis tanakae]